MEKPTDQQKISSLMYAVELAKMGVIPREQSAIFAEADRAIAKYFNNQNKV